MQEAPGREIQYFIFGIFARYNVITTIISTELRMLNEFRVAESGVMCTPLLEVRLNQI